MITTNEQLLLAQIRQAEEAEQQAATMRRTYQKRLDEYRLANRPTFPTSAQRAGIVEAARRIKAGVKARSHHGDCCGPPEAPGAVVCTGSDGWLSVLHDSPYYQYSTSGGRLWHFTDEESAALRALIEAEGLIVIESWEHDRGISFVARNASP